MEFEKAKKILNEQNELKYYDKEIREIIKLLEVFAKVKINNLLSKKEYEKCNPLR